MKVNLTSSSRLSQVDFSNLPFGKTFSDHMLVAYYKGGAWQEPEIMPYGPLPHTPAMHALHYGQAVFEGMKAYNDVSGEKVWLFRPEENYHRLNKSAERLCIPSVPKEVFFEGLKKLIEIDRAWIPRAEGHSLYIRPFLFASSEYIMATPADEYCFVILTSPTASYYSGSVKLKVETHFTRAAKGGTGAAKAAGNYAASFYPMSLAREEGYMQLLWTDGKDHKFLEEVGTMNLFFRKGDQLFTPPTSDSILSGITRKSVLELLPKIGIEAKVEPIHIQDFQAGLEDGSITEVFGVGTAAVVSPVDTVGIEGKNYKVEVKEDGHWKKLKTALTDIQFGRSEDEFGWRFPLI